MKVKNFLVYSLITQFTFTSSFQLFTPSKAHADTAETAAQISTETLRLNEALFAGLYENLLGSHKANPLDYYSLLRQDFIASNGNTFTIPKTSEMRIKVSHDTLTVVKDFSASDSLHPAGFDAKVSETNTEFKIYIHDKLVHRFRIPTEAIAVVGNYIVFIEKNLYNASENIRHLSFIDLNYFQLGKSDLPIFNVPIEGHAKVDSVEVKGGALHINGRKYESGLFDFAAEMQRILYNLNVNISDAKLSLRTVNYLEPFMDYFLENLRQAKTNSSEDHQKNLDLVLQEQLRRLQAVQNSSQGIEEGHLKILSDNFWDPIQKSFEKQNAQLHKQRGLVGRTGLLWQRMTVPRPHEVASLKESLITMTIGIYKKNLRKSDFREVSLQILNNKKVAFSTSMMAAAAYAYVAPESALYNLVATFDTIRMLGEMTFAKTIDFAVLGFENTKATMSGLNPFKLYEVYVADGAWRRTSVGVSAMFTMLTLVIGIPHVLVNSYYLIKDFKNTPGLSFVQRQKQLQRDYIQALSSENRPVLLETESEAQDKEARDFLQKMQQSKDAHESLYRRLMNSRIWLALSEFVDLQIPGLKLALSYTGKKIGNITNIETFSGSMIHFLFSFAAFTKSSIFYTTSWNYFFLLRALVFKPRVALTFMFFPNYFRRSIATEIGKITPPSFWNGGTRFFWQEIAHKFDRINDRDYFESINQFEKEIVEVERKANTNAVRESYKALQRYLAYNGDTILKTIEKGNTDKLSANYLKDLSYDARSFFSVYFDKLVEVSVSKYLQNTVTEQEGTNLDLSRKGLKSWFVHTKTSPLSNTQQPIEDIVREFASDPRLYEEAKEVVHRSKHFVTKQLSRQRHMVYWNLDPEHSGQFKRFVMAEQQMKKASAMARAVRANITALLVDKPMELALLFILVAGIQDGPNKPLWDTMFSENSSFYLSKNVFMGYLAGLIVSLFADVWVKIQRDVRLDALNGFDQVPKGEFANRSFRSWYFHEFQRNKNNTWKQHQINDAKLIYHNMGPAFVLMTVTGMLTLGRVDLDFYTLGYVSAFLLPFTGLSAKIEQTFDVASGWVLRHVPVHLRSHPLIAEWANKEITKLRIGFQLYYKLYENILGQFLGNLNAITTPQLGTRAFSRFLFGGKTVTEHVIGFTTAAATAVPGAKFIDNACRLLFTRNYDSGPLPVRPD